jgi:pimeloyl-ACP methyl ester carboxylesterase
MATAKISDGELFFEVRGQGEPLILLHCGFYDSRNWRQQFDAFAERFTVYAYDQRGYGRSSIPQKPHFPVEDLREFMDSQRIPAAHLLGHSIGGQIVADFAERYPERTRKIVLVSSGLDGYAWGPDFIAWITDLFSQPDPETMARKAHEAGTLKVVNQDPELRRETLRIITDNQ